jgi:hypothetical protein
MAADLLAPGHPLLDTVVDHTVLRCRDAVDRGAVLIDRLDPGEESRVLVAMQQVIVDGTGRTVLSTFEFAELISSGAVTGAGPAPYLDYQSATNDERALMDSVLREPWISRSERSAVQWAAAYLLPEAMAVVSAKVGATVARTRSLVRQRLLQEINYWDGRHGELLDAQRAGKRLRMSPETAHRRARELEERLNKRMDALDRENHLQPRPPVLVASALVVPQGLLDRLAGRRDQPVEYYVTDTRKAELRAVAAVVETERQLGRDPEVMAHNNPGYDIRSRSSDGHLVHIEVKGRVQDADTFVVTRNEVLLGRSAERYQLALVALGGDSDEDATVRYVSTRYEGIILDDFAAHAAVLDWPKFFSRGFHPLATPRSTP